MLLALNQVLSILIAGILAANGMPAFGSPYTMKGPPRSLPINAPGEQSPPVSASQAVLLKALNIYRRFISPTQGARCGFYPSCSSFGIHAVQHYGALQGVVMTADRLTRCNIFKQPGPDYYLRPDGRLYDPAEANLLKAR